MSNVEAQSYTNHSKFAPLYHFILAPISIIIFIASIVYIIKQQFSFSSLLIFGLSVCVVLLGAVVRQFATKLQDRSIVHEENFRHFRLTGKPLDARLSLPQIIALRFAEDDVFPALCVKAFEADLDSRAIKKSITKWRADHYRV